MRCVKKSHTRERFIQVYVDLVSHRVRADTCNEKQFLKTLQQKSYDI